MHVAIILWRTDVIWSWVTLCFDAVTLKLKMIFNTCCRSWASAGTLAKLSLEIFLIVWAIMHGWHRCNLFLSYALLQSISFVDKLWLLYCEGQMLSGPELRYASRRKNDYVEILCRLWTVGSELLRGLRRQMNLAIRQWGDWWHLFTN